MIKSHLSWGKLKVLLFFSLIALGFRRNLQQAIKIVKLDIQLNQKEKNGTLSKYEADTLKVLRKWQDDMLMKKIDNLDIYTYVIMYECIVNSK